MPRCRLCKADPDHQRVRASHVYGGREEHNFWQCDRCDIIYLYPPVSVEEEKHFYTHEFEQFMAARAEGDRDWSSPEKHVMANQDQVRRRWEFLAPHLKEGMHVLEIGCSSGFMLDAFRDFGLQCIGVEPSRVFLDYLKHKDHVAYADIEELKEHHPDPFDAIVHFFVFEHVGNPFSFLAEQLQLLKVGGVIIAEVPCATDPLTSLYDIPAFEDFYWSIAHHYYYTPRSMSYLLDTMSLSYRLLPEQRYDLSNHIVWMTKGRPGGQGTFQDVFSHELLRSYKQDLKAHWLCDTMIVEIVKK